MYRPHRDQGLTLVEMITVIAILGILAMVAAPSFITFRQNAERTRAVNAFVHAVFLARSEAIKRHSVVALCKSSSGLRCENAAGNWANGWVVFHNIDRDEPAQIDAGEAVLLRQAAWEHGRITSNPGRQTFSFRPTTQGSVNGTLLFCDERGGAEARALIISHTGRPRVSTRDANNKRLVCS